MHDSIHKEEWLQLLEFPETKIEEIIKQVSVILDEIYQKEKQLSEEREKSSETLSSVERKRNQAMEQNRLFDKLNEAADRMETLRLQSEGWELKRERLAIGERAEKAYTAEMQYKDRKKDWETAGKREAELEEELKKAGEILAVVKKAAVESQEASEKEVPKLTILLDRLNSSMPLYQDWKKMEELCRIKKSVEEESRKRFLEAEKELERVSLRLKEYEKRQESLTAAAAKLSDLKELTGQYTRKEEALKNLLQALKQYREVQLEVSQLRLSEKEAQTEYEEAQSRYATLYQSFFEHQAGLLAKDLNEGTACPVCGSIHHPQKAKFNDDSITAEMVDEARIKRDQANERRSEAALLTIRRYESCRHQEEWIKKEASLWFDPCTDLDLMDERFLLEEKETKTC
ncbi:hypothetical protein [Lacrimispora xylanisolvens]|uniref:hypothetical protein n=1 Tax=Lacrimispora xylanisolvens TaxID=384636 RepID=UPI002402D15F